MTALRFLAFVALAVAGPGAALQVLLRRHVDRAVVLPLGIAFVAGFQWLGLVTGLPLLPVAALGLDCFLLWRRPSSWVQGPSLRGALPALGALLLFLGATQYGGNRVGSDGAFVLDPLVAYDTAFHVGLTWELTFTAHPQVPGLSGVPLGYHLGTDLVRAAALRWAGVLPYDAISRFDVTLYAVALVLALRAVTARLGGSPVAVAFVGFTPLLGDLAWVLFGDVRATWWSDLLRGNLLVSLALANPVMPALALCLAALLCLDRPWLGALLAGAVPFFKVFLGAHLLLGLGAAWLLTRRRELFAPAVPCAIATALLVLGQGGESVRVSVQPFDLVRTTAENLGKPVNVVVWLLLSLGARWIALPPAWAARRDAAGAALAAMALSAWPLGLLFHVSAPQVMPGQPVVNDAAYLVEQGGPLLWVFAALALRRWPVALAVAFLSLPDAGQFVARKWQDGWDQVPAPRVRAMAALQGASQPGDVVLQRPGARYPAVPVVLAGRRVTYERFTPWLTQFAPPALLQQRHEQVVRFFRSHDEAEAMAVARELNARFVCLYDFDRFRFPARLVPVHEEPGAACYRLP